MIISRFARSRDYHSQGDITKVQTDAIVNASNRFLMGSSELHPAKDIGLIVYCLHKLEGAVRSSCVIYVLLDCLRCVCTPVDRAIHTAAGSQLAAACT